MPNTVPFFLGRDAGASLKPMPGVASNASPMELSSYRRLYEAIGPVGGAGPKSGARAAAGSSHQVVTRDPVSLVSLYLR